MNKTELDHITEFINSPAFELMSEVVKKETLAKQEELCIELINEEISLHIDPIIKKYGLKVAVKTLPIVKDTTKTEHTRQERIIVNRKYAQRAPNTGLCVFRKDGSHIQAYTAAETFVQAIKEAGVRNVMDMNFSVDRNNLILKHNHYSAPMQLHPVEPGYYVNVHSNNATKKRYLERISDELKLGWKIQIVD